ncbi:putative actin patch assembly and actin polymerization protein [Podila humilis]|nr:putative actin patch assembly and actin polymerization protein [Podila humilis]
MGLFSKQTAISSQVDTLTGLPAINQWDAVVSLCEAVNAKDDGAKEAGKALRKKLRLGRPQQQMNALTLIQAMVDGCGSKFKAQLATAKFVEDIEAVIISDATDANVKIRLMERLADWADKFMGDPGLAIVPQLYFNLVKNNTPRQVRQPKCTAPHSRGEAHSPPRAPITEEQRMRQMAQDIEVSRNNAHMLIEAVSFADPELEAIEENELIQEFHSKCQTLQRGIQQYLSEMTESANPNEQWLTSLLACNQELVQAFTAYNQMMERQQLSKVTKASQLNNAPTSPPANSAPGPEDLISFGGDGAGVGMGVVAGSPPRNGNIFSDTNGHSNGNLNGKQSSNGAAPTSNTSNGKDVTSVTSNTNAQPSNDPFADEPYYVAGAADVAAAVKMGKRPDNQDKIFDASAYFKQQQLEQEQLQRLKDQQKALHMEASAGSSQPTTSR